MIEWIIGAAVIGGILFGRGDKDKKPNIPQRTVKATLASPPLLSIDQNSDFSDWRKQWLHEIHDNAWISKGKATRIAEKPFVFFSKS